MKKILFICFTLFTVLAIVGSSDLHANFKNKMKQHGQNAATKGAQRIAEDKIGGRKHIGNTNTQEACYELAVNAGCAETFNWYSNTKGCFCN